MVLTILTLNTVFCLNILSVHSCYYGSGFCLNKVIITLSLLCVKREIKWRNVDNETLRGGSRQMALFTDVRDNNHVITNPRGGADLRCGPCGARNSNVLISLH